MGRSQQAGTRVRPREGGIGGREMREPGEDDNAMSCDDECVCVASMCCVGHGEERGVNGICSRCVLTELC